MATSKSSNTKKPQVVKQVARKPVSYSEVDMNEKSHIPIKKREPVPVQRRSDEPMKEVKLPKIHHSLELICSKIQSQQSGIANIDCKAIRKKTKK